MLRSASGLVAARTGRDVREPDAQARLALVEGLLASLDLQSSVQCALDWLGQHCGIHWSVCLVRDAKGRMLVPVGDRGKAGATWADDTLHVDDRSHPLVRALWSSAPAYIAPETSRFWPELGGACHAIPLRSSGQTESNDGVLVINAETPRLRPEIRWAAGVLGDQVFRLRSREELADTRFGRERTLLHGIVNAVTDPILLTDAEGRLILANAAAERLFTAPDDASEGWRQAVALNNMLFSAALSGSAVQPDSPARGELVLVDPFEGSDLLAELLSASLLDTREGTAVVSVLRNVTDLGRASRELEESYRQLRAAQEAARDQRRRLELIIDSVADPILVTDPAGDIVLMNARAEHFFRVASAAEAGEAHRPVETTNTARFSSFLSTVLTSGAERGWRDAMTLMDPASGASVPMEAIAGTVTSPQGELVWVVTILHDRTEELERARLYEELKRASEELEAKVQAATLELAQQNELLKRQRAEVEQASQLKSRFLANMSHEFRTPLNAILGYTQMSLHGVAGALTPEQRPNLERIDSNARHLLAIINDILDLSRIEAGQMPLHLSDVDVRDLVVEVLAELAPIIARSRLQVTRHTARRLPKLHTDRPKLKQILLNLLSNALKFTRRGSVRVLAVPHADGVAITVKDTGIGIAPADLIKIFEDFRQLDMSPSRGHGGTGLGLAICRHLALMLGGRITVASELGRGSSFTVVLPARTRRQ